MLAVGALPALQALAERSCLKIERVTAFTPRGEVYAEVNANCGEADFDGDEPFLAHIEVLVGQLPPVRRSVTVTRDEPSRSSTLLFEGLEFERADPILVRLVRLDEIVSIQIIKAP